MMWFLIVFCIVQFVRAGPITLESKKPIGELGNYFEGDIILSETQKKAILQGNMDHRTGVPFEVERWSSNILYYDFDNNISAEDRQTIEETLNIMSKLSCIKFKRISENEIQDYVYITRILSDGCYSEVGRQGGKQLLNLGDGCLKHATIEHEFLHALGFYHAQSAPNRDDYVTIHFENIREDLEDNFEKILNSDMLNLPYDYNSVMHYPEDAFSKNGLPTIEAKQSGVFIGQRIGMSELDIRRLNKLYKCPFGELNNQSE
ncbi:hypothetical protein DMENIID0001_091100 [Sergentomyia squamirostris]